MGVVCKTLLVVQVVLVLSCEVESCDPAGGARVELEATGGGTENLREKVKKNNYRYVVVIDKYKVPVCNQQFREWVVGLN